MSIGTIIVLVVVLVLIAAAVSAGAVMGTRRRGLRRRFGPEYDRTVAERPSRRVAETELAEREQRVQGYQLREVSDKARKLYEAQWDDVQELFVDNPAEAIGEGQLLIDAVMRERGYPASEFGQRVEDLSVWHARALDHFRSAHEVSQKAAAGEASTEEIRVAMIHGREIFAELLGSSELAGACPGSKASARAGKARSGGSGSVTARSGPAGR